MYVFGKGQSETTVSAPQTAVAKGTGVLITGTVLDMSPTQAGAPCVSQDSMSTQMEYLHLQRAIDGIWGNLSIFGIPVTLTAIGPDGQYIDLGTVTTSGYYGTFTLAWTPSEQGLYEIIASFDGSEAYGSSSASTSLLVGPAASASTPIEPEQPIPEEPTPEEPEPTVPEQPLISAELAIVIAVVAACIIGAVAYIALRRRK